VPIPKAAQEFDEISPQYDATREPLPGETIQKIAATLSERGVRSLLEVGVGTGRIARPLGDAGLRVTGVDASRGMLARARAKGIPRLVRGSAYHLPFLNSAFDGAIFVHVLHVLDDPRRAIGEASRVGRLGAFALVRPPRGADEPGRGEFREARRVVSRILGEQGYPVPARAAGGPPRRERELLAQFPPDELVVVTDRTVTEPAARSLDMIARGASRHLLHVPRDVLARAVESAREEIGDRTVTYRRVEAIASWRAVPASA
jgi:SAM-dependent methyltransferase